MMTGKKQKGLGSIGWLLSLAAGGFALLCFFRLGPAYLDNRYVVETLKNLATNNPNLGEMDKSEIQAQISKFLTINSVRGSEGRSFKIKRMQGKVLINSFYEVRVPILGNVDAVMVFESQLDSSNPEACCKYLVKDEEYESTK